MGGCFPTKKDRVARLEHYLEGLREHASAIEEQLAALREEDVP
jgi:hypothetical protein